MIHSNLLYKSETIPNIVIQQLAQSLLAKNKSSPRYPPTPCKKNAFSGYLPYHLKEKEEPRPRCSREKPISSELSPEEKASLPTVAKEICASTASMPDVLPPAIRLGAVGLSEAAAALRFTTNHHSIARLPCPRIVANNQHLPSIIVEMNVCASVCGNVDGVSLYSGRKLRRWRAVRRDRR